MNMQTNMREIRGKEIFDKGNQVNRLDDTHYIVNSQSNNGTYEVIHTELGWICSCCDSVYRGVKCKHQIAIEFSLELRNTVSRHVVIQPVNIQACPSCSAEIIV